MFTSSDNSLGNVLVIDDQEVVAKSIANHLAKSVPCLARHTKDPKAAVGDAKGEKYDLVVTDLRMPGRDGLAVLAEIKVLAPHCEVIVLTVRGSMSSAIEAMKLGAIEYIDREKNSDTYLDVATEAVRCALRFRPSARAPGYHRENLILFLLGRIGKPKATRGEVFGQFPPGLALEYTSKLLLESCAGFESTWHSFRTSNEENDLVCLNQSDHPFWRRQGLVILVECKDYGKKKPGDNERGRLERKILRRGGQSTVGIFISKSGFAKTFFTKPTTPVPGGGLPIIIPVDGEELWSWVEAVDRLGWITERAVTAVF